MMLTLRPNGFWARLFFRALAVCETFTGDEGRFVDRYRASGTNLCHFCRVIFVYAPLVIFANWLTWATVVAAALVMPIRWFGMGYGYFWLTTAGIVAAIFVVRWFVRYPWKFSVEVKPHPIVTETAALVGAFIVAQKRHVCPLIQFSQEAQ